ncbi:MAG: efflux RND transporter periplasmic adaptor subunit, partial [Anaerolineales bacterium]
FGILIVTFGAAGLYFWQQQRAAEELAASQIRTEIVARGTIVSTVSATGALAVESQVRLFFGAAQLAPVVEINVEFGDTVKQGEVLARLDATDLEMALKQAEQALRSAELALEQLTAPPRPEDLAAAEANLKLAQAQVYQATGASSKEQIEIARLNFVLAQNTLAQIDEQVDGLIEQGKFAEKQQFEAQQEQARDNAQIAALRYEQAKSPKGSGGSALAGLEQARVTLEKLKRGPDPDDVQIAQLQVNQARAAFEQAQNNLNDAKIVAPFDGVAAAVNFRVGEVATSQVPAIVLVKAGQFHIDVSVDEVDIARIAPGQMVTVTVDALPNALFSGVVDRIAPQAIVNAGVVSYPVRVSVHSDEARLRAGMTSTAEIVVQTAREVVLVPNWAIRREAGKAFAGVWRNGVVEEVEVKLGLRNETFSEVVAGLNAGDTVATATARPQFNLFGGGN